MTLISINNEKCKQCGLCAKDCPNEVLFQKDGGFPAAISPDNCIDCGHCIAICPSQVITHERLIDANCLPVLQDGIRADSMENFLLARRSIRLYQRKTVEKEVLERLLQVANMAPTSKNCQERGFIVVSDSKKIEEIKSVLLKNNRKVAFWLKVATGPVFSRLINKESVEALKKILQGFRITGAKASQGKDSIFHNAPCLVFIYGIGPDPLGKDNCLSAQQYLMSQAQAMGLGSCIIGYAQTAPKVLAKHLKGPKHYKIYGVLTLGYPELKYQRTVDRNPPQITWIGEPNESLKLKIA